MQDVLVLGEGAWGTAIASVIAENGHTVRLWCYHAHIADEISSHRTNSRYLPGVPIPDMVLPVTDLVDAVAHSQYIFEAIPVQFLRSVLERARPSYRSAQLWVVLSKGIEQDTLLFPVQLMQQIFGDSNNYVVVSGPSFAAEVACKSPTTVAVAAQSQGQAALIQQLLNTSYMYTQYTSDVIGVQIGGALKNVIALGMGMLQGAGCGDNAKAAFVTRGLAELSLLTDALGGFPTTAYGVAGVGDLLLTAYGTLSKNRAVGQALGAGDSLACILEKTGYIPEGINTARSISQLAQKLSISLPLCTAVHDILLEPTSAKDMVRRLLADNLP